MLSIITQKIETHLTIEKWTWGINMILDIYIYIFEHVRGFMYNKTMIDIELIDSVCISSFTF